MDYWSGSGALAALARNPMDVGFEWVEVLE